MEWMPELKFGLLNGWIAVGLLSLTDAVLFTVFPKDVVKRLFDRSGWSQKQAVFTVIGKLSAAGCIILLILTPLKTEAPLFVIGGMISLSGLIGLIKALFDFRNTPPNEPVSRGIYTVSRHPQIVMSSVVLLGGCIAIGSWSALLLLLAARFFSHWGIVAEEEVCLRQYGDEYREYLQRVPRYFIFF